MAAELKARYDMDKRYMWDLTQIYKTNTRTGKWP